MAKTDKGIESLTYEQAFSELQSIVERMEGEQQPLEETVKLYERGQVLARHCADLLDHAELRIKELNPVKSNPEAGE